MATATIADVFNAGRRITRMNGEDYRGCPDAYRADSNIRRCQRNAAHKLRAEALIPWNAVIPAGEYGRIEIGVDGSIQFCAGQYAPTEYYWHVQQLCHRMRQLRNAC